jgi:hypothetical protein
MLGLDMLGLAKRLQAFRPEFAAEPRQRKAAERCLKLGRIVDVDPDGAALEPLGERPCALEITRIDVRGKSEGRRVGDPSALASSRMRRTAAIGP